MCAGPSAAISLWWSTEERIKNSETIEFDKVLVTMINRIIIIEVVRKMQEPESTETCNYVHPSLKQMIMQLGMRRFWVGARYMWTIAVISYTL